MDFEVLNDRIDFLLIPREGEEDPPPPPHLTPATTTSTGVVSRVISRLREMTTTSLLDYIHLMRDILGLRFIAFLFFSQFFGKGMLLNLMGKLMLPLFKSMKDMDAAKLQIYIAISMIPWSIKPLMGAASDFILIGGEHKRGWLLVGWVVGFASAGAAFFLMHTPWVVICFVDLNFQVAAYDLLSESTYSEIRNDKAELGSNAVVMVNFFNTAGSFIVILFLGVLADQGLFWVLFLIVLALSFAPFFPTLWGWLPEERLVNAKFLQLVDQGKLKRERPVILLGIGCALGSILSSTLANAVGPVAGMISALISLVLSMVASWFIFDVRVNQIVLYQVISALSTPKIGSALDYFYTAPPSCIEEGPHFTWLYYITIAGIFGTIFTLLGTLLYQLYLSKLRFRPVLIITVILKGLGGLGDLSIILRWNVALGIPDKLAYFVGEAIFEPLVESFNWIASSALLSIAVEKGRAASTFAFMAGMYNYANLISEIMGAVLIRAANVETIENPRCDFAPLWWLVLTAHILCPAIIGVPNAFVVPDLRQTDTLETFAQRERGAGGVGVINDEGHVEEVLD